MADDVLQVEFVAADRLVWSGQAKQVKARTTEGDIGILPNHSPVLSLMIDGTVVVEPTDGDRWVAAVDSGFVSIADNRVSILAERAARAGEIDAAAARSELESLADAAAEDDAAQQRKRWAQAQLRAADEA